MKKLYPNNRASGHRRSQETGRGIVSDGVPAPAEARPIGGLLLDEAPLLVLPSLAMAVGLNEALILQQIHFWLKHKQADKEKYADGFREGRWWVYNTVEEWREQFPFWSGDTIQRGLTSLRGQGIVIAEQFGKADWNRTNWYTIDYGRLQNQTIPVSDVRQTKTARRGHREPQNATIEGGQSAAVHQGNLRQTLSETSAENSHRLQQHAPPEPSQDAAEDDVDEAVSLLVQEKVTQKRAEEIARGYPLERIRRQINLLPSRPVRKSRTGTLIAAIAEDWPAPDVPPAADDGEAARVKEAARRAQQAPRREARLAEEAETEARKQREDAQVEAFLSAAEADDLEVLAAEAREICPQFIRVDYDKSADRKAKFLRKAARVRLGLSVPEARTCVNPPAVSAGGLSA